MTDQANDRRLQQTGIRIYRTGYKYIVLTSNYIKVEVVSFFEKVLAIVYCTCYNS